VGTVHQAKFVPQNVKQIVICGDRALLVDFEEAPKITVLAEQYEFTEGLGGTSSANMKRKAVAVKPLESKYAQYVVQPLISSGKTLFLMISNVFKTFSILQRRSQPRQAVPKVEDFFKVCVHDEDEEMKDASQQQEEMDTIE
jgi:hypothetical protein